MKKSSLILIIIVSVVVLAVAITSVSLAIWRKNEHSSLYVDTDVLDENPSLRYQMYVPVVLSGDETTAETSAYKRISGTFSVKKMEYSYTTAETISADDIVGFSLAGWYGGVTLEYMQIPDEVTVTINGQKVTKPVVRVLVESDYGDYGFGGTNTTIQKIIVGKNVVEICTGAFYGMADLETVSFPESSKSIYLYPYCFGGCSSLKNVSNDRTLYPDCNPSLAYYGSLDG